MIGQRGIIRGDVIVLPRSLLSPRNKPAWMRLGFIDVVEIVLLLCFSFELAKKGFWGGGSWTKKRSGKLSLNGKCDTFMGELLSWKRFPFFSLRLWEESENGEGKKEKKAVLQFHSYSEVAFIASEIATVKLILSVEWKVIFLWGNYYRWEI